MASPCRERRTSRVVVRLIERPSGWAEAASRLFCATLPEGWSEQAILNLLASMRGRLWIAQAQGQLLGALLAECVLDELHLLQIAVHPHHRRQGIGRTLLAAAERYPGVQRLLLEVRPSNEAALALYRACSWQIVGRRRGYYAARRGKPAEDALLLVKELGRKHAGEDLCPFPS